MDEKSFATKKASVENDVIDFYNEYAESWDSRFGFAVSDQHFLYKRFASFEELLGSNIRNSVALELGVGTGVYIEQLSKKFRKIIAVDGSSEMLKVLNKKLKDKQIDNVTIIQSNVLSIKEVTDNSIDYIYFFGLIEHILDVNLFVNEIKRILKEDGIVIGVMPNGISPWYRLRKIVRGTDKHCSTDRYYCESDLKKLFSDDYFYFEKVVYWGAVPPGIDNKIVYKFFCIIEGLLEKTFLQKFFGGISFKFIKKSKI